MRFFHGTDSSALVRIGKGGLKNPFLTNAIDLARYYAGESSVQNGGIPVVLQVTVRDGSLLRYDGAAMSEPVMAKEESRDTAWNQASIDHPEWVKGKLLFVPRDAWTVSMDGVGSAWYEGVIPPRDIHPVE